MHVVSDPVSERSGNFFLAENEGVPGRGHEAEKWLVETELADTLEEQYFIAQTAGKSWPKGEAKIAKKIGQK